MQCKKCQAKWELQNNQKVTICPFCQEPLEQEKSNILPDSNEAKILKIIEDRGEIIYTKKEFIALIMDYFPNDNFGRLLKAVIEKKGALYVSKLKGFSGNELQINYAQLLEKLANETFIPKDVLTPAIDLLCFGLDIKVKSITPIQQPTTPISDFKIENGEIIKYIGNDCTSLKQITIPNSVTKIGDGAFSWCTSLAQVNIPNSVTSIGKFAFGICTSLTQINIPNSVTSIGDDTFKNCISLKQITIPNSVTKIGNRAFYGCTHLQQVNIPNSVIYIGIDTFNNCTSLTEITIPNSVTYIGDSAFDGCTDLTQINIPNSVTKIGRGTFFYCTSLKQINIPNSVTEIGIHAFDGCTDLTQINIPNSVTYIGDSAFSGCNNLPESVKKQILSLHPLAM